MINKRGCVPDTTNNLYKYNNGMAKYKTVETNITMERKKKQKGRKKRGKTFNVTITQYARTKYSGLNM